MSSFDLTEPLLLCENEQALIDMFHPAESEDGFRSGPETIGFADDKDRHYRHFIQIRQFGHVFGFSS